MAEGGYVQKVLDGLWEKVGCQGEEVFQERDVVLWIVVTAKRAVEREI